VRRNINAARPPRISYKQESDQIEHEGGDHDVLEVRVDRWPSGDARNEPCGERKDAGTEVGGLGIESIQVAMQPVHRSEAFANYHLGGWVRGLPPIRWELSQLRRGFVIQLLRRHPTKFTLAVQLGRTRVLPREGEQVQYVHARRILEIDTNIDWVAGLEKVTAWIEAHPGMWPAYAFKLLATTEGAAEPPTLRTLAAHFQAAPMPQATRSRTRLQAPLVIEGVITHHEFIGLIEQWKKGARGQIDHWSVPPPDGINHFWWQFDVPVSEDHFPLVEDLPAFPSKYREARLSGSGASMEQETRTWLQERLFDLDPSRAHAAVFSRDYLAAPWGMDSPYLLIHMPLAVAMDARYDPDDQRLLIEVHNRPPIVPADLEVRVGTGLYDASLEVHVPRQSGRDANGWDLSTVELALPPGGLVKVWLSRRGMVADFGWELTFDLGRARSPELVRERFLAEWYRFGHQELGQEVAARMPGMAKGDRPADAFELALANAFGAVGYSVIFAGHLLQSAGVDLIAFDDTSHRAYVISATTGNDLAGKLRTWLSMRPNIAPPLEAEWTIRPVIITTQPAESLVASELADCQRHDVLVLAAEQLTPLAETPPDVRTFAALVALDVPRPDPRPGRRFGLA